jgi:hypothetical protein
MKFITPNARAHILLFSWGKINRITKGRVNFKDFQSYGKSKSFLPWMLSIMLISLQYRYQRVLTANGYSFEFTRNFQNFLPIYVIIMLIYQI